MSHQNPSETKTSPAEPDFTALAADELLRRRTRFWPLSLLRPRPNERTPSLERPLAFAAGVLGRHLIHSRKMEVLAGILTGATAPGRTARTLRKRAQEEAVRMAATEAYDAFVANVIASAEERIRRVGGLNSADEPRLGTPATEAYLYLLRKFGGRLHDIRPGTYDEDVAEFKRLRKQYADLTYGVGPVFCRDDGNFYSQTEDKVTWKKGTAQLHAEDARKYAERYRDLIIANRDPGFRGDPAAAREREERFRRSLRERVAYLHDSLERAEDAYRLLETGGDPSVEARRPTKP